MTLFRFTDSTGPVGRLSQLQRQLERAFENPPFSLGFSGRGVFPPVNVFRDKDGIVVLVEVPGVEPEKLKLETAGRTLTITGSRDIKVPEGAAFHRREREMGQFSRSLQLPEDVDLSRAQASYKHGLLTLKVPKKEEAKPRQISVQAA